MIQFIGFVHLFTGSALGNVAGEPPSIASCLKPEVFQKVSRQREVHSYASLETIDDSTKPPLQRYRFYSAMSSSGTLRQAHRALTDFANFHRFLPFVSRTEYDAKARVLTLEGGVWDFAVRSKMRLTRITERWIEFEIFEGHFQGLRGELIAESRQPKGIFVLFRGELIGQGRFPPRFIMERAAEFVLDLSGKKMRNVIENVE